MDKSLTYEKAGVSIDTAKRWIEMVKPLAKSTFRPEVKSGIGGFGALFALRNEKYRNPVVVASTDGVGTKLKIAFMTGKDNTVGIDLVAMCVNDLVVQGAEPLFLLDYLSTSKLDEKVALEVMKGIVAGCKAAGCSLIGGETAQMPSFYASGEYDLAGFAVGVVEEDRIIDGSGVNVGNKLIGIAASGLHSNGYSLARVLPGGCKAVVYKDSWDVPPIFRLIQEGGNLSRSEMNRTFNNGIGMVLIVASDQVEDMLARL